MDDFSAVFKLNTPISDAEALSLHPMALAFVGDATQSLYVRTRVTVGKYSKTGALHRQVTEVVKAVAQAAEAEEIMPLFDETESEIFRKARNCKLQTSAKHAEIGEYRKASGFEAVLGYLFLTGRTERLEQFLAASYDIAVKKRED